MEPSMFGSQRLLEFGISVGVVATLIGLVLYLGARSGPVETPATDRQSVTILLASR